MVPVIRAVGEQLQNNQTKFELQQSLSNADDSGAGTCSRDDFINSVFDTVRILKPADLMKLLMAFTDDYPDHSINYQDFLRLAMRQGQVGGLEYQNQQMSLNQRN